MGSLVIVVQCKKQMKKSIKPSVSSFPWQHLLHIPEWGWNPSHSIQGRKGKKKQLTFKPLLYPALVPDFARCSLARSGGGAVVAEVMVVVVLGVKQAGPGASALDPPRRRGR